MPLELVHKAGGIPMVLVTAHTPLVRDDDLHGGEAVRPPSDTRLRPFYISKYETTQGQWRHVMGDIPTELRRYAQPASFDGMAFRVHLGDWFPCTGFSWADMQIFLDRLNVRLPTETEWECACYTDDESHPLVTPAQSLVDVRLTRANDLHLYGMLDNAAELCADSGDSPDDDTHVVRGYYKPSWRRRYSPRSQAAYVGFRIARDP